MTVQCRLVLVLMAIAGSAFSSTAIVQAAPNVVVIFADAPVFRSRRPHSRSMNTDSWLATTKFSMSSTRARRRSAI